MNHIDYHTNSNNMNIPLMVKSSKFVSFEMNSLSRDASVSMMAPKISTIIMICSEYLLRDFRFRAVSDGT
jgi:hypothetical protein